MRSAVKAYVTCRCGYRFAFGLKLGARRQCPKCFRRLVHTDKGIFYNDGSEALKT